jgi:ribosome biogenesis protein ERB1
VGRRRRYTRTGAGLAYIPAPKAELPVHDESYNPPAEFLPSAAEREAIEAAAEADDKVPFVPRSHDCLRRVPQYERLVQERFERCLDLYLCPRVRNKRIQYKPEDLVPKALPQPGDLRPFPNALCVTYSGHASKVRGVPA